MNDDYDKKCEKCKDTVSVFESVTEFGKHYHQNCYVHKLQLELEAYKKKWLDGNMSRGDNAIFLDKFQLTNKLKIAPQIEFNGWQPIKEHKRTQLSGEKRMIVDEQFRPILKDGKPQYEIDHTGSSMTTLSLRPNVRVTNRRQLKKSLSASKEQIRLTAADIPRLMEEL